ncbi:palmitoyltransferase ZDHHC4-like [Convolutriloba macropyga]|uniref:palmitoyltransferase ZDHHC4-like n=1 Tax=Convolutriloba macropyga TaxID=536237 RepID=UPI003F520B29
MALYQLAVIGGLFGIYLAAVLFLIYVGFFTSPQSTAPVRFTHLYIFQKLPRAIERVSPKFIQQAYSGFVDYIFYQRNRVFTTVFAVLQLLVFIQFFADVVPLSSKVSPPGVHNPSSSAPTGQISIESSSSYFGLLKSGGGRAQDLRVAVLCWIMNLIFWAACLFSDPGVITDKNVSELKLMYESREERLRHINRSANHKSNSRGAKQANMTNDMFVGQYKQCRTCKLDKILRSKHCSSCDVCVYRADHHCVWINNCVGGKNTLLFQLFLASLTIESLFGAYCLWGVITDAASFARLWEMRYRDNITQTVHPVNSFIVAQHMFKQFPRIVSLALLYLLLGIGLAVFFLFHQLLILSNYTTREMFKRKPTISNDDTVDNTGGAGKSRKGNQSTLRIKRSDKNKMQRMSNYEAEKCDRSSSSIKISPQVAENTITSSISDSSVSSMAVDGDQKNGKREEIMKKIEDVEEELPEINLPKSSLSPESSTALRKRNKQPSIVKSGVSIHDLLQSEETKRSKSEKKLVNRSSAPSSIVNRFTLSNSPHNYGFLLNILDAYAPKLCFEIRLRLKI